MTTEYTTNFGLAKPDFRMGPWHDLVNTNMDRVDAMLYSALAQSNVVAWQNSTHYSVGLSIIDISDATVWMCSITHTSSPAPTTFAQDRANHPTYWVRLLTGFAPRGEWKQSTQYFPYDLSYDSARGIMALCIVQHISTATGSILTDEANWAFLLDMSDVGTIIASAVTYSNSASGIPKTNVQDALDYIETQIVGLNNVNISQGTQITGLQNVNNTQDNRLTALEGKTSGVMTVPHLVTTDGGTIQVGGAAAVGWYNDATNFAIRPPGNGSLYFQSQGGATTYGLISASGWTVNGAIGISGALTANTVTAAGNMFVNGGGIYCYGWGGNGNIAVIFLNSSQNHYLYHDGTNITFQGCATVNAGNGRLWGANDFGTPVSNGRLVYVADYASGYSAGLAEPYGGAVITGASGFQGPGTPQQNCIINRYRYMQLYTTGWFTIGYA